MAFSVRLPWPRSRDSNWLASPFARSSPLFVGFSERHISTFGTPPSACQEEPATRGILEIWWSV